MSSVGRSGCNPQYTIEPGDAPLVVTAKFDISLDELDDANSNNPDWPTFYTDRQISLPPPEGCEAAVGRD